MARLRRRQGEDGEFLWLVSLSDLMILLFTFFVVLYSFTAKKLTQSELRRMVSTLRNEPLPPNPMDKMREKLGAWVTEQKLATRVSVVKRDDSLFVEISDSVLFPSGEVTPNPDGARVLRDLSRMLVKIPPAYHLGIEGHTDDTPIHTARIEDNWDLAAKRSLAVLHALDLPDDLLKRTVLMAYGETQPIVPNRDAEGNPILENQSRNRRVTLRIF